MYLLLFTNMLRLLCIIDIHMPCILYIPSFMSTTANMRYIVIDKFINVLPEAICCCLQTCYVYSVLLTLPCTNIATLMVTTANIR